MTRDDLTHALNRTAATLASIDRLALDDHDDAVVLAGAGMLAVLAEAIEAAPVGDELATFVGVMMAVEPDAPGHETVWS